MILDGAGVCPLVKIGDEVKKRSSRGLKVIDIICDRLRSATCRANKTLAMLRLDDPYREWHLVSPVEVDIVDCNSCPVLAEDPDHFNKTKWLEDLILASGKPRSSLVTSTKRSEDKEPDILELAAKSLEREHRDRFELIDITEEEESDEESGSDPNQQ